MLRLVRKCSFSATDDDEAPSSQPFFYWAFGLITARATIATTSYGKYDRTHHRLGFPISPVKLRSLPAPQKATAIPQPKTKPEDAFGLTAGSDTLGPSRNASETLVGLGRIGSLRCTEEEAGFSTKD